MFCSSSRVIVKSSGWGVTCLCRRQIQKHVLSRPAHVRSVTSKKLDLGINFKFKRTPSGKTLERHEKATEVTSTGGTTGYISSEDLLLTKAPLQLHRRKSLPIIIAEDPRIEPTAGYRRRAYISKQEKVEGEILYGVHPVSIALRQRRRQIHRLYLKRPEKNKNGRHRDDLESLADVPTEYVDVRRLDTLATGHVHQGVCMDVGPLDLRRSADGECHENQLCPESEFKFPLCVVMENVKDPMNFGAVLRSAYYFGVDQVFCGTKNSCKLSPVVSKASSGAMEIIDLSVVDNVQEFLQLRKQNGWCIVGTSCSEDEQVPLLDVLSFHIDRPIILILGNEGMGISRDVLSVCDVLLSINPAKQLDPGVDSLNVSAAAAILLHALMRKRPRNA